LKRNKYWTLPSFNQSSTKIWNIHNPLLNEKQIANPVNLDKNLIITGVNAGGKTTYVKSIASNIILAQTIGIINAIRGDMMIYDSIVSFMRISDEVGSKSYFEAETSYCSKMIEIAEDVKNRGGNGLFILDEPMHSTPYFEGVSVAYSIAKYMGELAGIRIIITTHFHKLIELGNIYPEKFLNLSVNALKINDKYEFDYKIRNGGSKQSIAIELLKRQELNDVIINSAIEMKNKICNEDVRQ
jgi:DNA mismatch repair protein MutS